METISTDLGNGKTTCQTKLETKWLAFPGLFLFCLFEIGPRPRFVPFGCPWRHRRLDHLEQNPTVVWVKSVSWSAIIVRVIHLSGVEYVNQEGGSEGLGFASTPFQGVCSEYIVRVLPRYVSWFWLGLKYFPGCGPSMPTIVSPDVITR